MISRTLPLDPGEQTVAVVFDLVQPVGPLRRLLHQCVASCGLGLSGIGALRAPAMLANRGVFIGMGDGYLRSCSGLSAMPSPDRWRSHRGIGRSRR